MTELHIKGNYGKVKIGKKEYSVIRINGLWSLGLNDYSNKFAFTNFIVNNKKRLSTIKKHASKLGIEIIEDYKD